MSGQILRGCSRCGRGFKPLKAHHRYCPACAAGNADRSPTTRERPARQERERMSAEVLAAAPACEIRGPGCTGIATTVDHIVPVAMGGGHERANLRPACAACNSTSGGHVAHQTRDEHEGVQEQAPRAQVARRLH